jgi:hypothetical protein
MMSIYVYMYIYSFHKIIVTSIAIAFLKLEENKHTATISNLK